MGSTVAKVLDPIGIFGGGGLIGGKKEKPAPAVAPTAKKPAPGAGAKRRVDEMEAEHRVGVQQRAKSASVALADEDREVLGAGRRLGRQSRLGGGAGGQNLGTLG